MIDITRINTFNEVIEGDNVLVLFYANWSSASKSVEESINKISDSLTEYKLYKIDMDRFLQLTRMYHITSVPVIKIFSNGKETKSITGIRTSDELLKEINE